ncbi:uncharacterized protein LOC110334037 [Mus pahari]|uniref:uncharacterized protein LOC110334037 n=1 Tax=Mus pahari TaxID=10093 RepID=UPI000A309D72|nr:uncharacterized protein LOC110334037 [Mus pahari]
MAGSSRQNFSPGWRSRFTTLCGLRISFFPRSLVTNGTQRPPRGRLRMRFVAYQTSNASSSTAAADTTRRQAPHSAAIFARSQRALGGLGPARARAPAPGSRGYEGGVGDFDCQRPGFLHRPCGSAALHWPPSVAPALVSAAQGSRCAQRPAPGTRFDSSPAPPGPPAAPGWLPFLCALRLRSSLLLDVLQAPPKQANKSIKAGRALNRLGLGSLEKIGGC